MAKANTIQKLKKISIFSKLSNKELSEISKLMTQIKVKEGRLLVKQGAVGSDFMIIIEGKAVVRRNNRKIAEIKKGDFVGEMTILSGAPRYATIEALTDMTVEVLNRREFLSLLDKNPRLTKNILVTAMNRLQNMESSKTN